MAKITIFGLAGTGKTSAGQGVAKSLGYDFQSSGSMFRKLASDSNITLFELEEISKKNEKFDIELDKQVSEYGKQNDDFVFESRLAWHFIPDSFKIRLFCDLDERVMRIAKREGKDFEIAKTETLEREEAIFFRYKKYYGIEDIDNPNKFDLNIDTKENDLNRVIEIILENVNKRSIV